MEPRTYSPKAITTSHATKQLGTHVIATRPSRQRLDKRTTKKRKIPRFKAETIEARACFGRKRRSALHLSGKVGQGEVAVSANGSRIGRGRGGLRETEERQRRLRHSKNDRSVRASLGRNPAARHCGCAGLMTQSKFTVHGAQWPVCGSRCQCYPLLLSRARARSPNSLLAGAARLENRFPISSGPGQP